MGWLIAGRETARLVGDTLGSEGVHGEVVRGQDGR